MKRPVSRSEFQMLPGVFIVLLILCSNINVSAQGTIGSWQEHLPYYSAQIIAETDDRIYCSTEQGLFYYNRTYGNIEKITKITGLSDVGINTIEYNKDTDVLLIAYKNSNIDLIEGKTISNIPDIKNKIMSGNKSINNILFINKTAYLACGFGIVVVDVEKQEINDTYYIGNESSPVNVHDLAFDGMMLMAATEEGIYYADINEPALADYHNWNKFDNLPSSNGEYTNLEIFNDLVFTTFNNKTSSGSDTIYVFDYTGWSVFSEHEDVDYHKLEVCYDQLLIVRDNYVKAYNHDFEQLIFMHTYPFGKGQIHHSILDNEGFYWYADEHYGLIKSKVAHEAESFHPDGPYENSCTDIDISNGILVAAGGNRTEAWNNDYSKSGIYTYHNSAWQNLNEIQSEGYPDNIWDINEIAIDPFNSNHFFAGSWGFGVLEFLNNEYVATYDASNSSLQSILSGPYCRIGGMEFDDNGNLWVTNAGVDNLVSVFTTEEEWIGLNYGSAANANVAGDIIITQYNHKWIILPEGNGLFVFDDNGTPANLNDDEFTKLTVKDEDGEVINDVYSIAEDKDGLIWVGTNQGVLVYYNPASVFNSSINAHRIIVDFDGIPQHLLGTETVTTIKIDGGNRKWFGTKSAGAFLMSDDATEQIHHFNSSNSPLLSNRITAIGLDDESGVVYFATQSGITSFRGSSTEGTADFEGLYVFPNPVRPEFTGDIAIKGTYTNANVKITDISGNLVYETTALGGQAIWDGKDFSGSRVHTGVYLVFCTNEDGSETEVTKLLFVH